MSDNPLLEIEPIKDVPLAPSVAVSALAMNFALKYADTIIIKDGAMYQQKKLEGANIQALSMADVMHYALQFETWLLTGEERQMKLLQSDLAKQLMATIMDVIGEIVEMPSEDDDNDAG